MSRILLDALPDADVSLCPSCTVTDCCLRGKPLARDSTIASCAANGTMSFVSYATTPGNVLGEHRGNRGGMQLGRTDGAKGNHRGKGGAREISMHTAKASAANFETKRWRGLLRDHKDRRFLILDTAVGR